MHVCTRAQYNTWVNVPHNYHHLDRISLGLLILCWFIHSSRQFEKQRWRPKYRFSHPSVFFKRKPKALCFPEMHKSTLLYLSRLSLAENPTTNKQTKKLCLEKNTSCSYQLILV
uniref:Uncharacterized protein n=1 Tax=Micrurus corallinus TaxID=54390 RepID=A0A2D4G7J3_MICCO